MVVHVPLNRISVYGLRGEVVDLSCLGMHCGENVGPQVVVLGL